MTSGIGVPHGLRGETLGHRHLSISVVEADTCDLRGIPRPGRPASRLSHAKRHIDLKSLICCSRRDLEVSVDTLALRTRYTRGCRCECAQSG